MQVNYPPQAKGLRLTEVFINVMNPQNPLVKADAVYVRGDGTNCGRLSVQEGWPPAVLAAVQLLQERLEEAFADQFFETPSHLAATNPPAVPEEPKQF